MVRKLRLLEEAALPLEHTSVIVLLPQVPYGQHRDGASVRHSKQEDVSAAAERNDKLPERGIRSHSRRDSRCEWEVGERAERNGRDLRCPPGARGGLLGKEPDEGSPHRVRRTEFVAKGGVEPDVDAVVLALKAGTVEV